MSEPCQTHVEKLFCKYFIIPKGFWQHKIYIKDLLRAELSQIEGKIVYFHVTCGFIVTRFAFEPQNDYIYFQ